MIATDFLALLRCPQTGQALMLAEPEVLARLNDRMKQANRVDGTSGAEPITAALVRQDRYLLYPMRDGIPVLLAEAAIVL